MVRLDLASGLRAAVRGGALGKRPGPRGLAAKGRKIPNGTGQPEVFALESGPRLAFFILFLLVRRIAPPEPSRCSDTLFVLSLARPGSDSIHYYALLPAHRVGIQPDSGGYAYMRTYFGYSSFLLQLKLGKGYPYLSLKSWERT